MQRLASVGPPAAALLLLCAWPGTAAAQPPGGAQPPAAPQIPSQPPPAPETPAEVADQAERPRAPAQLAVRSNVPAAEVLVDGALVGRTPLPSAVAIVPGEHLLELRRRGYRDVRRPLNLAEGARADVTVELFEDPGAPPSETGTLAVAVSEDNAVLLLDGQARTIHRGGSPGDAASGAATPITGLPLGPHLLRVERAGFLPVERMVNVPAGQTATVHVTLQPTPETYAAYLRRTRTARTLGVGAVSTGIALLVGGAALAITRQLSLPQARRRRDEERREQEVPMNGGPCDPSLPLTDDEITVCDARLQAAYDAVYIREQLRLVGMIGAGVGLLAAGAGIFLLSTGDDPHKYDTLAAPTPPPRRLWAQPWLGASGGGLMVGSRF
jgi:hypothetical protein